MMMMMTSMMNDDDDNDQLKKVWPAAKYKLVKAVILPKNSPCY